MQIDELIWYSHPGWIRWIQASDCAAMVVTLNIELATAAAFYMIQHIPCHWLCHSNILQRNNQSMRWFCVYTTSQSTHRTEHTQTQTHHFAVYIVYEENQQQNTTTTTKYKSDKEASVFTVVVWWNNHSFAKKRRYFFLYSCLPSKEKIGYRVCQCSWQCECASRVGLLVPTCILWIFISTFLCAFSRSPVRRYLVRYTAVASSHTVSSSHSIFQYYVYTHCILCVCIDALCTYSITTVWWLLCANTICTYTKYEHTVACIIGMTTFLNDMNVICSYLLFWFYSIFFFFFCCCCVLCGIFIFQHRQVDPA